MEEYKEDATKGKSILNPINYKCDTLVQVWIDARILATLDLWMDSNGVFPKSYSEVARRPLEMLVETLVGDGLAQMVEDTTVAREHLARKYRVSLNRRDRGAKNILHNQILSDRRRDLGSRLTQDKGDDLSKPIVANSRVDAIMERVKAAQEIVASDIKDRESILEYGRTHSRSEMPEYMRKMVDEAEMEELNRSSNEVISEMVKSGRVVEGK